MVGGCFFLNKSGQWRIHAAQQAGAVAFGHTESAVQQVAKAVGQFRVVALLEALDAEIGVASSRDVAEKVIPQRGLSIAAHEDIGIDNIPETLAHLSAGNVPPTVNEQRGHLGIGEAEGVEHDHPVNAVRRDEDVLADDLQGWPAGFEEAEIGSRPRVIACEADIV